MPNAIVNPYAAYAPGSPFIYPVVNPLLSSVQTYAGTNATIINTFGPGALTAALANNAGDLAMVVLASSGPPVQVMTRTAAAVLYPALAAGLANPASTGSVALVMGGSVSSIVITSVIPQRTVTGHQIAWKQVTNPLTSYTEAILRTDTLTSANVGALGTAIAAVIANPGGGAQNVACSGTLTQIVVTASGNPCTSVTLALQNPNGTTLVTYTLDRTDLFTVATALAANGISTSLKALTGYGYADVTAAAMISAAVQFA